MKAVDFLKSQRYFNLKRLFISFTVPLEIFTPFYFFLRMYMLKVEFNGLAINLICIPYLKM